jgi:DNA-binding beta-propeller fold protein YncE
MTNWNRSALVMASALGLLCAFGGTNPLLAQRRSAGTTEATALAWPAPPAPAAVRFVETLPRTDDSGHGSFLRTLGRVFSLSRKPEGIVRPLGIAAHDGVLYVADPGSHALLIYDMKHNRFRRIDKAGKENLASPVGVAAGGDQIYVSDSALKKVFVYDKRGRFLRVFTEEPLERPTGLAFDQRSGRLYVADTIAHQVLVFSTRGKLENRLGRRGTAAGEFNYPTHLWLDRTASLFVIDSLNYRVQIFRNDGSVETAFGHQGDSSGTFASPKGIALDSQGHLYVVDALFDSVQIFNRQGGLLLTFGERGTRPGQFWLPSGIFIDDQDRIYVADSQNQRVQVFEFLGEPGNVR